MGRGRKGLLTQSNKQKIKNLKRYGVIPTLFRNIPKEEIELEFPITEQRSNNLVSLEMIRVAQSLTPQQLAALILN